MTMQVQIRHADGADVSLDECASFSAPMSEAIETSKLTNEAYALAKIAGIKTCQSYNQQYGTNFISAMFPDNSVESKFGVKNDKNWSAKEALTSL